MSPDGFYKTYTTGNSSKKKIKFEKKYPQDFDHGVDSDVWNHIEECHKEIDRLNIKVNRSIIEREK